MERILNRSFTLGAAAALFSAGLIATTPTAPPIPLPAPSVQHIDIQLTSDMFTALGNSVAALSTDTWGALFSVAGLHLSTAAVYVSYSLFNAVSVPQNLIIGGLAALTGVSDPDYLGTATPLVGFSADIFSSLQSIFNNVVQEISNGVNSLFSLNLVDAFVDFSNAFDGAVLFIPGELIIGPLMALGL